MICTYQKTLFLEQTDLGVKVLSKVQPLEISNVLKLLKTQK